MNCKIGLFIIIPVLSLLFSSCELISDASGYGGNGGNGGGGDEEEIFPVSSGTLGDILWEYNLGNSELKFVGDPAFDKSRQTVYVTVEAASVSSGENVRVLAVNGDGTKKWESNPGDFRTGGCPIIGGDGIVYYHGMNVIYALNPVTGGNLWVYNITDREIKNLYYHSERKLVVIAGGVKGGMAIIGEDGKGIDDTFEGDVDFYEGLSIGPNNNLVSQLSGQSWDGSQWEDFNWLNKRSVGLSEVWRVHLKDYQLASSNLPVSGSGDIFVSQTGVDMMGKVEAYYSNQNLKWVYSFSNSQSVANTVIGPDGSYISVHPVDGLVVFSSTGIITVSNIGVNLMEGRTAVDAQGNFFGKEKYVGNNFGVFNASGQLLWSKNISWENSSPVIVDNGAILIVGHSTITAVQGYSSLSKSYARARGDNRNTGRGNY